MPVFARHLLPVVEPRRRTKHRPGGGGGGGRPIPDAIVLPHAEPGSPPASPARALAIVALATLRRARRPSSRPDRWSEARFGREVDLIRAHLVPVRSRQVLAASFGREAFHGDPSGIAGATGSVAAAYAIRWLELGDGRDRPRWDAWLAESTAEPTIQAR